MKKLVYLKADGKVVRIKSPLADPTKITKRERRKLIKNRIKYKRSKISICPMISAWKNPHSLLISLENRVKIANLSKTKINVNYEAFSNLKTALDAIENSFSIKYNEKDSILIDTDQFVQEVSHEKD